MIEEAIYALLSSERSITEMVGTRIEPMSNAQGGTLPAISYRNYGGNDHACICGPTGGLFTGTYAIECKASNFKDAHELAARVVRRLVGFRGTIAGESINWIRRDSDHDDYVPPQDASCRGVHIVAREFDIWYGTEIPTAVAV